MKDGYYMKIWLIRPSNGNQLQKNLGLTTLVLLKEVANIANEAKLAVVMRRLEALETKELVSVNQISPTPSAGCTYCQAMNHVFEECPVFLAHQMLPEHECSFHKAR